VRRFRTRLLAQLRVDRDVPAEERLQAAEDVAHEGISGLKCRINAAQIRPNPTRGSTNATSFLQLSSDFDVLDAAGWRGNWATVLAQAGQVQLNCLADGAFGLLDGRTGCHAPGRSVS
jgi:hypothetical protein